VVGLLDDTFRVNDQMTTTCPPFRFRFCSLKTEKCKTIQVIMIIITMIIITIITIFITVIIIIIIIITILYHHHHKKSPS